MNIDGSYFVSGRRSIMNAPGNTTAVNMQVVGVSSTINGYIDQYGPEFLRKVLGPAMAKEMLDSDGSDEVYPKMFEALKEPWADYVMYNMLRFCGQRVTADGVVEMKGGNSHVSPAVYQSNVWNGMVDGLRLFCSEYPTIRVDESLLKKISPCWI